MPGTVDDDTSLPGSNRSPKPTNTNANTTDQTESELFYVSHGRSLKALSILCQGLVDELGDPLVVYSILPWNSAGKSSIVKPNAIDLRAEVLHRTALSDILIAPCPKAWTITRATEWLNEHPITGEDDIAFIKRTIAEHANAAEKAAAKKAQEARDLKSSGANWIGKYALVVDHDEIKRGFHTCHNLPGGCMQSKIEILRRQEHHLFGSSLWISGTTHCSYQTQQHYLMSIQTSPSWSHWHLTQWVTCSLLQQRKVRGNGSQWIYN